VIVSDNITLFQNDPQQIIAGSSVELRCADNYELDPTSFGSLVIQCQNDGTWTSLPQCKCKLIFGIVDIFCSVNTNRSSIIV